MSTADAIDKLKDSLSIDEDYFEGWQANIAMAFIDEVTKYKQNSGFDFLSTNNLHIIANQAAKNFLKTLMTD